MSEPNRPVKNEDQMEVELDSVVLERLIEEVRNDGLNVSQAYDRVHNRHNR